MMMTEPPDKWDAEVNVSEDFDTGEKIILLRIFKNQGHEASYVVDSLRVYEQSISSTKWEAQEKEND